MTVFSNLETGKRVEEGALSPISAKASKKTVTAVTAPLFQMPPERIPHPDGGYLPDWLAAEIHASPGPRFRTIAAWSRCPKCAAIILTGLDDPCVAMAATVDPTPIDPTGELVCALENRRTYRVFLQGTGARIQARHKWQPPAGGDPPVVPAHNCTFRFPGFIIKPASERPANETAPPF